MEHMFNKYLSKLEGEVCELQRRKTKKASSFRKKAKEIIAKRENLLEALRREELFTDNQLINQETFFFGYLNL